jgi:hypothetical protein
MLTRGINSIARSSAILFAAVLVSLLVALAFRAFGGPTSNLAAAPQTSQSADLGLDCGQSGVEIQERTYAIPGGAGQPASAEEGWKKDVLRQYPKLDETKVSRTRSDAKSADFTFRTDDGRILAVFLVKRYGDGWRLDSYKACASLNELGG